MRKSTFSAMIFIALIALVAVASAALPATVMAKVSYPGPNSYFNVDIKSGGNIELPNHDNYLGWCGAALIHGAPKDLTSYTPIDSRVPATYPSGLSSANWEKINWVLNHKAGADKNTLQAVIWHYADKPVPSQPYNVALYTAIVADAELNGGGFVPAAPGQKYAVILWKSASVQPVFVEATIPENNVPEFPSLALPVAMLLGTVFTVYTLKSRED
jgi:hypothetical protein